jgi:hypothetical protein
MSVTSDRHDGCLHEIDPETGMQRCYLVLPDGQRKDLVRPLRTTYIHERCGTATTMGRAIAETYAAQPAFYGATMCVHCKTHFRVGPEGEFVWEDGTKVGT